MTNVGLVAALLAGVIVFGQTLSWSHGLSGAQFRRMERALAIGLGLVLGSSLISASLIGLTPRPVSTPEPGLRAATVITGVAAAMLGAAWVAGFRRYIKWSIGRAPRIFGGRGFDLFPAFVWALARWLPGALLIIGGVALVSGP